MPLKKATLVTVLLIIMVASGTLGIMSARRQNWAYRIYVQLYEQKQKLSGARKLPSQWVKARNNTTAPALSEEQKKAITKLSALPYLKGYSSAPDVKSVTVYNTEFAYNGINFVLSADAPRAFLMDMGGNIIHEWHKDFNVVWPEPFHIDDLPEGGGIKDYWKRARLLSNGNLLAIFTDYGLIKLNKNSNLLWSYKARCHHDMFETKNGNIYVLTRELKNRNNLQLESHVIERPILEDFITILNSEGKEIRKVSLIECILNSEYAPILEHIKMPEDVLHANTIRPIDGKLVDSHPMFKKGHILVSMRDIHTIVVVDLEQEKVTWAVTGMWKYQHEPRLLENGNILVFDNKGNNGKSRIVEFNPLTLEVVWSYKGDPAEAFYSRLAGTNERLPNGNTLITETRAGRAFEVTSSGEIVWEFYNPARLGKKSELIAALYDVIRLEPDQLAWLTLSSTID